MTLFTGVCLYATWQLHCYLTNKLQQRNDRFKGITPEYDPSDPETVAKMTDKERVYAEPGGPWELKDISGRKFTHKDLRGSYYMLYFGHTLCPDATPLTVHKMTKVVRQIKQSKENQYINCKAVFVTVKPEQDNQKNLREFKQMFDPAAKLIVLTANHNKAPNLVTMMRNFKVSVGLTPEEQEVAKAFFAQKQEKEKKWYHVFKRQKSLELSDQNESSRVIYLMSQDNQFLQFYDIGTDTNELANQITEEISYDIGIRHVGKGTRPAVR